MKQDIVDVLLSKFKTPSEIQKVIKYLSDNDTRNSILEKLESSMYRDAILKSEDKQKNNLKRKDEPLNKHLIDHLCKILRDELHMNNFEVEIWFKNKYGIQKNIRKSGLRTYLRQIINSEGNEFLRTVLTDLSLIMRDQGKKDKELENWWNEFDQTKNSRLLDVVNKHFNDLKDFLQGWKSSLPLVPSVEELHFDINEPTFESLVRDSRINKIEKDLLFEDFKNYHLPKGYETFPDDWEKYKELLKEYFNKHNNIVDKIKYKIQEERLRFSAESVYTRAVILLKGGRWIYFKNHSQLMYGVPETGNGFILSENGTDEEDKKCEDQHKTFSDKIKSEYEADLNDLIEKGRYLKKRRISLVKIFENLERYPGFPNMEDCDIIKRSFYK